MPIFFSRGRPDGIGHWRRTALAVTAGGFGCVMSAAAWPSRRAAAQPAQSATAAATEEQRLAQPQLEQMLAPIALYPDTLLMQVLMASTYPLEVVQAKRWLGQGNNASLRGDALATALEAQPWDPSVKSLVPFPDVLTMMNDQLDWTQRLGDAVLEQQQDVLNAVQALRARAQAAGKLESGPQQTVTVTRNAAAAPPPPRAVAVAAPAVPPPQEVIAIEPTQPDQVYVPAYDPSVVYGSWPYPSYPPAHYPPPAGWGVGNAILTGMAFAGGAALVGSLWGWARPGWGSGDIDVNVNRFNAINANRGQISSGRWQHDVAHRQGVAYRNSEVSNRFRGGDAASRAQSREQFRGRADQAQRGGGIADRSRPGAGERPGTADRSRPGAGERPGTADRSRPGTVADRGQPGTASRPGAADRSGAGAANRGPGGGADRAQRADRSPGGAQRPAVQQSPGGGRPNVAQARSSPASPRDGASAFSGVGQGQDVRAASARGQASRTAGPPAARSGGAPMTTQRAGGGGGGPAAAAQRAGGGGGGGRAAAAPRGGGGGGGRGRR